MFLKEQNKKQWQEVLKNPISPKQNNNCKIEPYVAAGDYEKLSIPCKDFINPYIPWYNTALIAINNSIDANRAALAALNNGFQAIIFKDSCANNSTYDSSLLEDIDLSIAPIYCLNFSLNIDNGGISITNPENILDITGLKNSGAYPVLEATYILYHLSTIFKASNPGNVFIYTAMDCNFLAETAKIRAIRYLSKAMAAIYNYDVKIQIFATNCDINKTETDSENNIIRGTIETIAAILGDVDGFVSNITIKEDADFNNRIGSNIQHLLYHESHFGKNLNTVENAHSIEAITTEIVEDAWDEFLRIKDYDKESARSYFAEKAHINFTNHCEMLKSGNATMVGINKYKNENTTYNELYDVLIKRYESIFK